MRTSDRNWMQVEEYLRRDDRAVLPYGPTPSFMAYPGTVTLKLRNYLAVVRDVLDSLAAHGLRRVLVVNGHGGNQPVSNLASEWMAEHPGTQVRFHNWWNAPKTWAKVMEIDPVASHASWMENFARVRVAGVVQPQVRRPMVDFAKLRVQDPKGARELLAAGWGWFSPRFRRAGSPPPTGIVRPCRS